MKSAEGPCQTDNPEGILNLSEHFQLSPQQCKLILKGLKFVPTPAFVNREELTMDIDNLINDIKHTYIMDFIEGTKQARTLTSKTGNLDNSPQTWLCVSEGGQGIHGWPNLGGGIPR